MGFTIFSACIPQDTPAQSTEDYFRVRAGMFPGGWRTNLHMRFFFFWVGGGVPHFRRRTRPGGLLAWSTPTGSRKLDWWSFLPRNETGVLFGAICSRLRTHYRRQSQRCVTLATCGLPPWFRRYLRLVMNCSFSGLSQGLVKIISQVDGPSGFLSHHDLSLLLMPFTGLYVRRRWFVGRSRDRPMQSY